MPDLLTPPNLTIYTIGHGNRSPEEFLSLLEKAGIRCLVDVRRFPGSRKFPHFNREALEKALAEREIRYLFAGEALGGRRRAHPASPHTAIRTPGFRGYADHMETAAFRQGVAQLLSLAKRVPTAVMCAERLPWRCHRFFLSDYLTVQGVTVLHLIDERKRESHRLNPLARIEEGRLTYDGKEPEQLSLDW